MQCPGKQRCCYNSSGQTMQPSATPVCHMWRKWLLMPVVHLWLRCGHVREAVSYPSDVLDWKYFLLTDSRGMMIRNAKTVIPDRITVWIHHHNSWPLQFVTCCIIAAFLFVSLVQLLALNMIIINLSPLLKEYMWSKICVSDFLDVVLPFVFVYKALCYQPSLQPSGCWLMLSVRIPVFSSMRAPSARPFSRVWGQLRVQWIPWFYFRRIRMIWRNP